jgi:hypothetical protein
MELWKEEADAPDLPIEKPMRLTFRLLEVYTNASHPTPE